MSTLTRNSAAARLKLLRRTILTILKSGKRHQLEFINVLDESGLINENGGSYQGLERYAARDKVVADLQELGLLEQIEDYANAVGGMLSLPNHH